MSLQDQLLKAGLVSKEKAREHEKSRKKQTHLTKKDKRLAQQSAQDQAEKQRRLEEEERARKERDRALERERQAKLKQREERSRVKQIIESQRLASAEGEVRYHFKRSATQIHYIWVSTAQQRQLATGQLAIVSGGEDPYDFPLLPREAAERVAAIWPEAVLQLYPRVRLDQVDDVADNDHS